ncbi:MAG: pentapeptide repeat-containing protein [Gaiellaceae bacterium]
MTGTSVAVAAVILIGVVLVPGLFLVWPSRREPGCRTDLGVALLTGALVAFTVLAVQIVFDLRFSELDRKRQEAQNQRDAILSMKLAISSQKDLSGIQLQNLDLSRFYFGGKSLTFAQMQGTRLVDAVLDGVDLSYADLSEGNLTGANLRGAKLAEAALANAKLDNVIATTADFTNAVLTGATLRGADLSGAKLQGADLTRATLPSDALSATEYDARTRWPAGLAIPSCPAAKKACVTD